MQDPVSELAEKLISIMTKEKSLYIKLSQIFNDCQKALIKVDMKKVNELVQQGQPIIAEVLAMSKERVSLMKELVEKLNIPEQNANARTISKKLPEQQGADFLKTARELKETIFNTLHINKLNKILIHQSLLHIQEFFRIVSGESEANITYNKRGINRKAIPNGLIDRRI